MNAEAIQKKLEEYYSKTTPEQLLKEFEALGVEFVVIPEVQQIEFGCGLNFSFEFNDDSRSWVEDFLVDWQDAGTSGSSSSVTPARVATPPTQEDAALPTAGNYQYAMAA